MFRYPISIHKMFKYIFRRRYDWRLIFRDGESVLDSSGLFTVKHTIRKDNLSVLISSEDLQIGRKDKYYSMYGLLQFRSKLHLKPLT